MFLIRKKIILPSVCFSCVHSFFKNVYDPASDAYEHILKNETNTSEKSKMKNKHIKHLEVEFLHHQGYSNDGGQKSRRTSTTTDTIFSTHQLVSNKAPPLRFAPCVHSKLNFTMLFINLQNMYSQVLATLRVGDQSLGLPSSIQLIMERGRALLLGGAVRLRKTHSYPCKDCDPTEPQHLPCTRTKPPAQ